MQRLTERNKSGRAMAACCGKACEYNYCCETGGFSECKGMDDIIDRLADLEDIIGDNYDLDRLRKLMEADKAVSAGKGGDPDESAQETAGERLP